jgi:hypothetical protein
MKRLSQWRTHFACSISILLLVSAAAKLIGIFQNKPFLAMPDGVFPSFETQQLLIAAIIIEITMAAFIFVKRSKSSSALACLWLTAIFLLYHILASLLYVQQPCHCLGGIFDWTRIPQKILNELPVFLLAYMGFGGAVFFLNEVFTRERKVIGFRNCLFHD